MSRQHPNQKYLIFMGVDDCLCDCGDDDPRVQMMHEWITKICTENLSVTPSTFISFKDYQDETETT